MANRYFARGKLLITAEYMILFGARALAVPLTLGQWLIPGNKQSRGIFHWTARYKKQTWFETRIRIDTLTVESATDRQTADHLVFLLGELLELKPGFAAQLEKRDITTRLDFDPAWGFGSSSTLTSLLAQWAGADPLQFHFRISRGSGYDVACASANGPLLYELIDDMPVVETIDFYPSFANQLYFIYLGEKQRSDRSVASFLDHYIPTARDIDHFSGLTYRLIKAPTLREFGEIMHEHEESLSGILQKPALREQRFGKLEGYVKSLGAWGGDFALVATDLPESELRSYLENKGISTVFPYKEIVYYGNEV